MIDKNIQNKDRRLDVMMELKELADKNYQLKEWVQPGNPMHFWYCHFEFSMDLFIEDLWGLDPQDLIGYAFYDEKELEYVLKVADLIEKVVDTVGFPKEDSLYLNCPYWDEMVSASKEAFDLLNEKTDYETLYRSIIKS